MTVSAASPPRRIRVLVADDSAVMRSLSQLPIAVAMTFQEIGSRFDRQFHGLIEQSLQTLPAFG